MNTTRNTVLITGGATGIGYCLAEEFLKAGNKVIICGRREQKLNEAKRKLPEIHTYVCDVSSPYEREALYNWVTSNFKDINILVNNAGIQLMIDLKAGLRDLRANENELDINLGSTIHLSAYFIPEFMKRSEAAIINVSSGLGFVPIAIMPVYCATKAAIHSFTISLRHQLKNTSVKVFEIIPPTVDTDLDKGARARRGQAFRGIPPSEVAVSTMAALAKDEFEHGVDQAQNLVAAASQSGFYEQFNRMNH